MSNLDHLFQPIEIAGLELPNRIVFLAAATEYYDNGYVSQRERDYLVARARGGVGLLTTGMIVPAFMDNLPLNVIYDDKFVPALRELTDAVHAEGAKIAAQIGIQYYWSKGEAEPVEEVGPSAVATRRNSNPRELTVDEIRQIVQDFGEAARRARGAGLDAVEIHCGIGYLINRFLSPLTNRRTDGYGGSLENRMRFMLEIVASSKREVGDDYPLICRMCADDFMQGGQGLDETRQMAIALETAGVHCLNVAAGWHECRTPLVYMSVPRGNFVYLAEEIKKVVNVPVIAGYRVNDPVLAGSIIADGRADLVGVARALIADPEFPNKAREGRYDDIRPCIACGHCLDAVMLGAPVACAVNPQVGKEAEYTGQPTDKPKKVYVVGGGPAGMEAAAEAARRGHKVSLFERSGKLGGNLLLAAVPSYKWEIKNLINYLETQLRKSGVEVMLNSEVNEAVIGEGKPDAVIVATGSRPVIPDIPGVKEQNVATALEVLAGDKEVGERVVVVGGGQVGCETAEYLAEKGKQVTIVEMLRRLGNDIGVTTRWVVVQRLRDAGIGIKTNARVIEITDTGVKVVRDDSSEFFEVDSVVLAVGLEPNNELLKRLTGKVADFHAIGDCVEPQKIFNAIESGSRVAGEI